MTTSTRGESILSRQGLESFICEKVAAMVGALARDILPHEPLQRYGVSSAQALELMALLSEKTGRQLAPTLAWEHPSAEALARRIAEDSTPIWPFGVDLGEDPGTAAAKLHLEVVEPFESGKAVGGPSRGVVPSRPPRIAFVFSPQGGQWTGMGRELMRTEPAFRAKLVACDLAIRERGGWSVLDELQAPGPRSGEVDRIQPAMFALQVALAAQWEALGVRPEVVVGYSFGEIAAAHVAGILDLNEAARVVCLYSQLQAKTVGNGGMALVELGAEETESRIRRFVGRVCVAGFNSVKSTLISGVPEAIDTLLAELRREGVFGARVRVNVAPHGPQMDPILPEMRAAMAGIRAKRASVPMLSTCSSSYWRNGVYLHGEDFDGEYLAHNLRQPVRLASAVQRLLAEGIEYFVEIGPHPVLQRSIQQCITAAGSSARVLASARRDGERSAMFESLAALVPAGAGVLSASAERAWLDHRAPEGLV